MKKFALAALAVAALAIGGCANGQFNPIAAIENIYSAATGSTMTPEAVYLLSNTFDVAVKAAATYDRLPVCGTQKGVACRQAAIVKQVDALVRQGQKVRNQLISYVLANPGQTVPVSNYNTLKTIVSAIESYVSSSQASTSP